MTSEVHGWTLYTGTSVHLSPSQPISINVHFNIIIALMPKSPKYEYYMKLNEWLFLSPLFISILQKLYGMCSYWCSHYLKSLLTLYRPPLWCPSLPNMNVIWDCIEHSYHCLFCSYCEECVHAAGGMEAPQQYLRGFITTFGVAEGVGAVTVILVTVWAGNYRGGFTWRSNPDIQFNWHPVLMTLGMIFLYANCKWHEYYSFSCFLWQ